MCHLLSNRTWNESVDTLIKYNPDRLYMVTGSRYDSGPLHFSDPARTRPAVLGRTPLTTTYRDGHAVISIGSFQLTSPVILAPMAGVTDRPFRTMCRQ